LFAERGIEPPLLSPLVRARMTHINGVSVKEREYPDPGAEWFVNREQNLSWAVNLADSNELLEGEWWPADYSGPALVSIEEERSVETGLGLGDVIDFEVAGQTVTATISSVRKVNWDSFQPNFFLVLSPGALDGFPSTWIASLRVEPDERPALVDLVRAYPTISVIDLDAVLAQIRGIIEKASLAVQAVFFFTLAAGIAVLFAAVQSTIDERRFESAMLRALGAARRTVFAGVMAEFAALGIAAGVLASAGASALAAVMAERLFNLPYSFSPLLWVVGLGSGILVVCASGYLAARGAINAAPVDVLRSAAA
jgi:putative ABC transport system permease protein